MVNAARHLRVACPALWVDVPRGIHPRMKKRYLRLVRQAFRTLRHRKLRHRRWWQAISRPLFHRSLWMPCRDTVATGLAIGLFFSMVPVIPQSIFAAIFAMLMRANVPMAMAACFISNPLTNVPFWLAQISLGQWLIDTFSIPIPPLLAKASMHLPGVGEISVSNFMVGFPALGLLMALCSYPIVHLLSMFLPHHLPVRTLRMRTLANNRRRQSEVKPGESI
jgi:uncharacterized protein (DUF2062 family)